MRAPARPAAASRRSCSSATRSPAGASGRNGGFLLAGLAAFYNDARERYGAERARRLYARTLEAQEEIFALAARARRRRRGTAHRAPARLRFRGGGRARAPPRRALNADGFPGELVERDELPPALRRAFLNACLHRPRRRAPAGALDPGAGAAPPSRPARASTRASRSPVPCRRGDVRTARRHRPRATRGRRGGRRAAASRAGHRRPRAGAAAAHGRHRAAAGAARRLARLRALGLRVLPADPRRPAAGGRLLRPRRRRSYTDRDEGEPAVWERIERYLADDLGVEAPITHRWVGTVGYSVDGLPVVGEVRTPGPTTSRAATRATATCWATSPASSWPT